MINIIKSELFPLLNDIVFAEKDPDTITKEIVALYESSSGRTLAQSDPVRLFIDAIILAVVQQHNVIDRAAKMNLLAYAEGEYLDHLGALLGVSRLPASHASCSIRFTLGHFYSYNVNIPAGTKISSGAMTFATTSDVVIPAGSLSVDADASCLTAGSSGNGYVPGQVSRLVEAMAIDVTAENVTTTSGGSDTESDEAFRERIQIAPESFSVAGPTKAYEYHARTADADIIAVAVVGPPDTQPGYVDIYPLMTGGILPSDAVLAKVYEACNASDIRPDTDFVSVKKPVVVSYSVDMTYWLNEKDSSAAGLIMSQCESAVEDWVSWQRSALGRDINPSELIHRVMSAGGKRVEVRQPVFREVKAWELGICSGKSVNYGGLEGA